MRRLASRAALAAGLLLVPAPGGAFPGPGALAPLVREGEPRRHTADTLWERIDGEAELYRAFGLVSSEHARYAHPADRERAVEVSVFTMAEPLGAFGLLAAFRPRSCERLLSLGNGACADDRQGILWQGSAFVVADAAGPDATRAADVRRALEAAAADLGPAPPRPGEVRAFAGVAEPATIRFHPQHLLGRSALPPGLEGRAAGLTVLAATGPQDAAAVLERYAGVLEERERGERGGRPLLSGVDPELGPMTLLAAPGGVVGVRALARAPGAGAALDALAAPGGGPGTEASW